MKLIFMIFKMVFAIAICVVALVLLGQFFMPGAGGLMNYFIIESPIVLRMVIVIVCGLIIRSANAGKSEILASMIAMEVILLILYSYLRALGWNGFYYFGFPVAMPIYDMLACFGVIKIWPPKIRQPNP